ncbi:epimerase [Halarcobacter ebronensis]|uniref:Epimerase n=1 Tax=Halarcobacter ebronensis TaxID=1462615 RepID=A0A4Q0YAS1_9BACT|nr:NAD-dependent epimerase/dehydratase family protein [Halarcobacter ebronensis]RXJ67410.1 epimerase [Halarcobacter ebronensis]
MRNKTILITGGGGFIGSYLADMLKENNTVKVFDTFSRNAIQYISNEGIELIKGDVLDPQALNDAMKGVDICIHAAAIAGIYSVGKDIQKTMKVNTIGAYNAIEAAIANGVEKFVDFSTSEVYGAFVYKANEKDNTTIGPIGERRWTYAISKLASEHLVHSYGASGLINTITVRPFNIYGPRQIGEGAIQKMISAAINGEDITIYNDGSQIRSWCYVTDFAKGLIGILNDDRIKNEVFNIGNPNETTTVLNLARAIIEKTGSSSKLIFKEHPGPEIEVRIPDIEKLKIVGNYTPIVTLNEGLERTIDWFKKYQI